MSINLKRVLVTGFMTAAIALAGSATAGAADFGRPAGGPADAVLACGYTDISFEYPNNANPPHFSLFYYYVNGSWHKSDWFYFDGSTQWVYDGSWANTTGVQRTIPVGSAAVTVWGYEYRYYLNGYTELENLGSCSTDSADGGGFIFVNG